MPFRWAEFLDVAVYVAAGHSTFSNEAATRCAVSRAYYAAYCHARNWAIANMGFSATQQAQDHEALARWYKERRRADIAQLLDTLRIQRNACDYDDAIAPAMNAVALIRAAQRLITALPARIR